MKIILMMISHTLMLGVGFALGIYLLPILTAPPAPTEQIIRHFDSAQFTAKFSKQRQDSDFFHWGEGKLNISTSQITFMGDLAPGPDYRLYLSPQFVETEAKFNQLKSKMVQVGDIKSFSGFSVNLDSSVDINKFNTVVIWCESFGEFITSAQYKE